MESEILSAAVIAVVTGVVSGGLSAMGTMKGMRVHIDYIRQSIDKHDARLAAVEKEQHKMAGAMGVNTMPQQRINKY